MKTTAHRILLTTALAGATLLAGCANGSFHPGLSVGLGIGSGGRVGGGVSISTPIGNPGGPVVGNIGIGAGSGGGGVGIGIGMGGSTVLNQPAVDSPPPARLPARTDGAAPADWAPVSGKAVTSQTVNQAPAGSAFRDWPWGVQRVSP
ncbi:MAG: hypothetical protein QMB72_09560 [Brachymonas denitrificans]|uniref:hypothetical protein n=1 Tax=Brachymonas denitrificans TaxID=28220 RepID=UPI001BCB31D3|nr:hypothetical protein [Brachymonas denitrificans]